MGASDDRTPDADGGGLDAGAPAVVLSYAADDVALDALTRRAAEDEPARCHVCDAAIDGESAGSGLLVWTRGEEIRHEEPPLCEACAAAIGLTALRRWAVEDDEEG